MERKKAVRAPRAKRRKAPQKVAPKKGARKAPKKRVKIGKNLSLPRGKESQLQKRKGGSNVGEYKNVRKSEFCGPAGGSPEGSYPVNTKKRARAALAYARNAPNPKGIRRCVRSKYPQMGASRKGRKK